MYENCDDSIAIAATTNVHNNRQLLNPSVTRFITELEPGSLACDVGSGDGRYLTAQINPKIFTLGVDRCFRLTKLAHERGGEVCNCYHKIKCNIHSDIQTIVESFIPIKILC